MLGLNKAINCLLTISIQRRAAWQNSTRTEQGIGLLTISVHVAGQVSTRTEQGIGRLTISVHVAGPVSTRTEQGIGLLTISVHVAGGQFGQAKFAVSFVRDSL